PPRRRRALLLVGLPRRRLPPAPRPAHRPDPPQPVPGRALHPRAHRPQRPQGQAAERPRPGVRRHRRLTPPGRAGSPGPGSCRWDRVLTLRRPGAGPLATGGALRSLRALPPLAVLAFGAVYLAAGAGFLL